MNSLQAGVQNHRYDITDDSKKGLKKKAQTIDVILIAICFTLSLVTLIIKAREIINDKNEFQTTGNNILLIDGVVEILIYLFIIYNTSNQFKNEKGISIFQLVDFSPFMCYISVYFMIQWQSIYNLTNYSLSGELNELITPVYCFAYFFLIVRMVPLYVAIK